MARKINRLTARFVATVKEPGRHPDGGSLYLVVEASEAKRWAFLFRDRQTGKLREMGLGGLASLSLADARDEAGKHRTALAKGLDPFEVRDAARRAAKVTTFGEVADAYIADKVSAFRNPKHRAQWAMTLKEYAKRLRGMPVATIGTDDVLAVLKPIWSVIPETAGRLRGRIEVILDAARARGLIPPNEANPARWRGHLDKLLPRRSKLSRGNHAAMAYGELPAFIASLRERQGASLAAFALEFKILTAARSEETFAARWDEIDLDAKLWTLAGDRMKAGEEHCVPLTARALAILEAMKLWRRNEFIFPGQRGNPHLSSEAMRSLYRKRMGLKIATEHGFRSTFFDWGSEETTFNKRELDMALAHAIKDKTEAAYRRGKLLAKRRKVMEAWAAYCEPTGGNVVPLRRPA